MKKILVLFLVLISFLSFSVAEARTSVRGYVRKSTGTYVMPYYRSSANSTRFDNWSMKGNYNPYTGKKGYTNPFKF